MSKVVYMLRHAQSLGKQSNQRDYERTLSLLGVSQARQLGVRLKQLGIGADRVLSSSAIRARETFTLVNESLGLSEEKVYFSDSLYETLMVHCLDEIQRTPESATSVLLVGHNPWLSMLASKLSGSTIELAPCEFMGLTFDVSRWQDVSNRGKEIHRIKPE